MDLEIIVNIILKLIKNVEILSANFRDHMQPFLGRNTMHFTHEFYHFARSPLSIAVYDHNVVYDNHEALTNSPIEINSPDTPTNHDRDSDVIILPTPENLSIMVDDDSSDILICDETPGHSGWNTPWNDMSRRSESDNVSPSTSTNTRRYEKHKRYQNMPCTYPEHIKFITSSSESDNDAHQSSADCYQLNTRIKPCSNSSQTIDSIITQNEEHSRDSEDHGDKEVKKSSAATYHNMDKGGTGDRYADGNDTDGADADDEASVNTQRNLYSCRHKKKSTISTRKHKPHDGTPHCKGSAGCSSQSRSEYKLRTVDSDVSVTKSKRANSTLINIDDVAADIGQAISSSNNCGTYSRFWENYRHQSGGDGAEKLLREKILDKNKVHNSKKKTRKADRKK